MSSDTVKSSQINFDIQNLFDDEWYLNTYQDVKESQKNPYEHYINNGRYEGRWPCKLNTLELEDTLWLTDGQSGKTDLQIKISNLPLKSPENFHAAFVLARWHASHGRWHEVNSCMDAFYSASMGAEMIAHSVPPLLRFSGLFYTDEKEKAKIFINEQIKKMGNNPDLLLARSMTDNAGDTLDTINEIYTSEGLLKITLKKPGDGPILDNLDGNCNAFEHNSPSLLYKITHPCVTVIMPAHNSGDTILTSLTSLAQQTWKNLDIIVIDDASTDDTFHKVTAFSKLDNRVRLIKNDYNQGAYASRNKALTISKGKFITVHDSDDWSHPEKIERQVRVLISNNKLVATISHWVRCEPDLTFFHWRMETGWIYRNISSLMFRRRVFRILGYWDRIKVGGDTEYFYRILQTYGADSIQDVLPGIPLSFGRHSRESLSQHHSTNLLTTVKGVRKDYQDAYKRWHSRSKDLFLPACPQSRPFPVPDNLLVKPDEEQVKRHQKEIVRSGLFDADWYLKTYPDIAASGDNPMMHYILHGGYEGRDPGPNFSSSGYAFKYLKNYPEIINPLAHYILKGEQQGKQALPVIPGAIDINENNKTVLICAHSSGAQIFGSERSLLDVLVCLFYSTPLFLVEIWGLTLR